MLKYHIDNDLEDIDLIETHQETKPGIFLWQILNMVNSEILNVEISDNLFSVQK